MSNQMNPAFAEDRDRLHIQMMSAVSHDLKTPLASIIGSLEIFNKMKASLSEENKLALIQTALEEAYRLDGFITNILDMARLENGMTKLSIRSYDIEQIIQDCMQKLGELGREADISVVKPAGQVLCETDASLLTRALQCLLDNAVRHSGEAHPKIQIKYTVENNILSIQIQDNGVGIADEDHEKVFSKYTRLAKKDYKNAGTGLGLTIARAITRILGGNVTLTNSPDKIFKGACFTISLPCHAA